MSDIYQLLIEYQEMVDEGQSHSQDFSKKAPSNLRGSTSNKKWIILSTCFHHCIIIITENFKKWSVCSSSPSHATASKALCWESWKIWCFKQILHCFFNSKMWPPCILLYLPTLPSTAKITRTRRTELSVLFKCSQAVVQAFLMPWLPVVNNNFFRLLLFG